MLARSYGRTAHQIRPVQVSYRSFGYAAGSVLFELGNTKILCSVSIQSGVPQFLKGKRVGWLSAEYALLPTSTQVRSLRDNAQNKKNERAIEISRLIGRALRAIVDLTALGERTIVVDCDVLQADGSTRTAAITGSYLALRAAVNHWLATGELSHDIITDSIAAVSVGWYRGQALIDVDYAEDSQVDADYNFVLTGSEKIVEIQGTAEKNALAWPDFMAMVEAAQIGIRTINSELVRMQTSKQEPQDTKVKLFSLQARLNAQRA